VSRDDESRRAFGRLLRSAGELLEDDDKLAAAEAKVREVRARVGNDPRAALELARQIAEAFQKGRRQ
jgi:hypothetical protein